MLKHRGPLEAVSGSELATVQLEPFEELRGASREVASSARTVQELSTVRKLQLRIVPYVALLYFISFLDRANVAYAKLTMAPDLGFSEWVYGFGAGLFFLGYMLLQIPGGLIVERWGMRRITTMILCIWGMCAMSLSVIHTAGAFFLGRFLLGVAEGGLVPGIVVYLSHWFPGQYRARAMAGFFLCSPVALATGGPLAALLLQIHWLGLAGWRWLAILEGIPALFFGGLTWFALTEKPSDAGWLSAAERMWLVEALEAEQAAKPAPARIGLLVLFRTPILLVLCAIIFLSNIGIQGFFLWLPTTVRRVSGMSAPLAALVSGLPFATAALSTWLCSWSSDRTQRRALHIYAPMLLAGLIFSLTASTTLPFGWLLFWLCTSAAAIYGSGPSFYLVPTLLFSEATAAAAVGMVNMAAGLGGFVGPVVVGKILQLGYPFSVAIKFLSASFFAGGLLCFVVRNRMRAPGRGSASE